MYRNLNLTTIDKAEILRMYVADALSIKEVAATFSKNGTRLSRRTIRRIVVEMGGTVRPRGRKSPTGAPRKPEPFSKAEDPTCQTTALTGFTVFNA